MYITPIQKLDILKNNNIYVKRDDLLPFSFGGNKVRIAEEYFNDLKSQKKDVLVAYGNSRSNLCRIMSNMAYKQGIKCVVISPSDDDGSIQITNNSILVNSCETEYIHCEKGKVSETVSMVLDSLRNKGMNPYYIYGDKYGKGNEHTPVNAYFKVFDEILIQEKEIGIHFDYIFLSTGTGMTQSGLISGKIINKTNQKIVGISVARNKKNEEKVLNDYIQSFMNKKYDTSKQDYYNEIIIDDSYIGDGYGKANNNILNLIKEVYKKEGLYLDPTYTGKGFYGMVDYLKKKGIKNKNVLFIHTGGAPLFFDNIDRIF